MAGSLFEFIAAKIEGRTGLDKLEARGTLRIALKEAGLDSRGVTTEQMSVMLQKTMPAELVARGIEAAEGLCLELVTALEANSFGEPRDAPESPEEVFRRLGER